METGSGRQAAADAWLVQKLRAEWSAGELGALLTRERVADALASFPRLETPVKARLLLAALSVREEEARDCRAPLQELLALAETDSEEWVRVSAGMVSQMQALDEGGAATDSYFQQQLARTAEVIVGAVQSPNQSRERTLDDFLVFENALLHPSIRPELALKPAKHFTVIAPPPEAGGKGGDREERHPKKPVHRPQMARPLLHPSSSTSTTPSRATPPSAKPPVPKKNMSDVTSEIRRKADAGRFKRQRSRISMIDIDEVKQIESEKAQKAEERKKQKLLAKEKEKASASAGANTDSAAASIENTGDESNGGDGGQTAASHADNGSVESGGNADAYENQSDRQDTQSDDEQSAASGSRPGSSIEVEMDAPPSSYETDGARALLSAAALHSSHDILNSEPPMEHTYHHPQQSLPPYQPVYHQQQHLIPPPPQFQHRGFEPEDAGSHVGFGNYGYGSHPEPSHAGYYDSQMAGYHQDSNQFGYDPRQAPRGLPPQGFYPDQPADFDASHQQQQQQQQHQQQQHRGYMDGPPEYWR